jgi:hypothetical protein
LGTQSRQAAKDRIGGDPPESEVGTDTEDDNRGFFRPAADPKIVI